MIFCSDANVLGGDGARKGYKELGGWSWHRMIPGEDNNKVSIIVANWNGERFLKDCLGAFSDQNYRNCEIILVDNGSADDSVRIGRENFPAVKIVALSETNKRFHGW